MDEKLKKSLRTLGQHQPADGPRPSIVSGIKKAAMAQSEATRQAPPPGPHLPHQGFAPLAPPKPQTYSLRVERIRQLSDEQLMQYLTRESVPSDGELDDGTKMAITMELMRRQSEEASQPHRPTFWMLVVSLVLTFLFGVWGVVKDVRNSNPPPQQAAPTEPQAPIDSKTQPDRS